MAKLVDFSEAKELASSLFFSSLFKYMIKLSAWKSHMLREEL